MFKRILRHVISQALSDVIKPYTYKPRNPKITITDKVEITDFPHRIFVVTGKPKAGKTTLAVELTNYLAKKCLIFGKIDETLKEKFKVPVECLDSFHEMLEKANGCTIFLDDIKSRIPKSLFEFLRRQRHKETNVIVTHHILNKVPTEILQLAERIIMFNSLVSYAKNSKFRMLVPPSRFNRFAEVVTTLPQYNFIVIKDGKVYGNFYSDYGKNLEPILKPMNEIKLNKLKPYRRKYRFIIRQVHCYLKDKPLDNPYYRIDYEEICRRFNISYDYARRIVCILRKRKLIPPKKPANPNPNIFIVTNMRA